MGAVDLAARHARQCAIKLLVLAGREAAYTAVEPAAISAALAACFKALMTIGVSNAEIDQAILIIEAETASQQKGDSGGETPPGQDAAL